MRYGVWMSLVPADDMSVARRPQASDRSYVVAVCLSAIFGVLGVQHFYLRRWGEGLLDVGLTASAAYSFLVAEAPLTGLAFMGLDLLHTIVVTSLLFIGRFKDGSGRVVAYPGQKLD
ncbi:MAG: TM2 domain-containing protein [Myxococcales bacterium FL481]|nr:MAG: TM2 domain-containing protein [Myxococcales bacterium FL481]